MVFQSIATPSAELEYVSDRDGGFKRPLDRCKLLIRWTFEYFDQTNLPGCKSPCSRSCANISTRKLLVSGRYMFAGSYQMQSTQRFNPSPDMLL